MKRNIITIVIGATLVIIVALLLFVFQVRQSQVAIVTTFGKPVRSITEPGAYFKWPWPIQKVYIFDQRAQNFTGKFEESQTADSSMILTSVYVGWHISNGMRFLEVFRGGSIPAAQQMLEHMLRSADLAVVANHDMADFVNPDPGRLKFNAIENEIRQNVQSQLSTNNCGMSLDFLGFKRIGLPEDVTEAVFTRMKSERQELISKYQSDGDAEAAKIRSAAERQAAAVMARANEEAIGIRAQGEREAASTYGVFEQNPQLAEFLLRIDALQRSMNRKTTLIFDERQPPFDLFMHLPTNAPAAASAGKNDTASGQ